MPKPYKGFGSFCGSGQTLKPQNRKARKPQTPLSVNRVACFMSRRPREGLGFRVQGLGLGFWVSVLDYMSTPLGFTKLV